MRGPNQEQLKAIEHTGGVLLSAGAGSGKTFVLVEHIIYLLEKFRVEHQGAVAEIRSYLSGIVLMTFTKKAAGELALRLKKRIRQQEELGENVDFWQQASSAISAMTVSTIHGFCYRLLGQGFLRDFDTNIEIISEVESQNRVERLFVNWYQRAQNTAMVEVLIANYRLMVESLQSIFGTPELRLLWREISPEELYHSDLSGFFEDYFRLVDLDDFFTIPFDLSSYHEYESKTWFKLILGLEELKRRVHLSDKASLQQYLDFFQVNKGVRAPSGKLGLLAVEKYFEQMKLVRKFLQENQENFVAYFDHGADQFLNWVRTFKQLFSYIDENYRMFPGVTFSDLEYYVLTGLQNKEVCQGIRKRYKYFIVDEFQDTSYVQFNIIKKLIDNDFSQLFCVGDMKQAIYGFRGGELGVFWECMREIPQNLSLCNNYRSRSEVIAFNNQLFSMLFVKGPKFEGTDKFSVEVQAQLSPLETGPGQINCICAEIAGTGEDKLSVEKLNFLEAQALFFQIEEILQRDSDAQICVLYRKLGPSKYLISKLLGAGISFSAQIKVGFSEDPVMGIFSVLLESYLSPQEMSAYCSILIKGYLRHLQIMVPEELEDITRQFFQQIKMLGVFESYKKFLFELGVSNSSYRNNMAFLESICLVCNGNIDRILERLSLSRDGSYATEFQVGAQKSSVVIMTAHASKGLEFEHVMLGGIHTNGTSAGQRDFFGKNPGSVCWKLDSVQKKAFKAPEYLLEGEINKRKEFAESKRLFYVACTRAQNGLSWIDLRRDGELLSYNRDSWINGLRLYQDSSIVVKHCSVDLQEGNCAEGAMPLFHRDNLGLVSRNPFSSSDELGIVSDLSVTRLAVISECPRKFYLLNICRLDSKNFFSDEKREDSLVEDSDELQLHSSAERGTMIHQQIEKMLKGEGPSSTEPMFAWLNAQLSPFRETHEFLSEEAIKFSLFGHMINGIPDLILLPRQGKKGHLAIWDFKTGKHEIFKEVAYWFQLRLYAYAIATRHHLQETEQISLVLAFVDEQKILCQKIDLSQLSQCLANEWKKLGHLYQVNEDFCEHCQFGNICHCI